VRDALNDPDAHTRRSARLRVQSALKELGCRWSAKSMKTASGLSG
jgi:hypothetical protein